ncbi:MAG: MBL fold metallo-hydrolase [Candidatus Hecatellales archaeon]|nr:MAG: MBL fold metallo-hydrolase [Candidatus Hecatellales archaeon]
MKVRTLVVGPIATNCYIIYCEETGKALILDPGGEGNLILKAVEELNVEVEYIVNSHGHYDHIAANGELKEALNVPLLIHREDSEALVEPELNLSVLFGLHYRSPKADKLLEEGDELKVGKFKLKVLHTPGHTPGSICLLGEKEIFTGDTLFAGSVGRTDLPGGSFQKLAYSLKHRIAALPDWLKVYPGHGPATMLGYEKESNPYLRYF